MHCVVSGEEGSRTAKVVVEDGQYSFSKLVKPHLEELASSWGIKPPTESTRKYSNHLCLIIKIMMNKANINSGIGLNRIDWSKSEDPIFKFKD